MFMNKARAYVAPEVEILDVEDAPENFISANVTVEAGFAVSYETGAQTEDFGYAEDDGEWN